MAWNLIKRGTTLRLRNKGGLAIHEQSSEVAVQDRTGGQGTQHVVQVAVVWETLKISNRKKRMKYVGTVVPVHA
jgi:hypothetical protein